MKLPALHIGNLTATVPIVQGGMGIGVSLSGLASAVANEGGVGVISAANVGFNEPDFKTNTVNANLRALKSELLNSNLTPMATPSMPCLNSFLERTSFSSLTQ